MAKKVKIKKKGSNRLLSLIFHLVVLVVMVNLYDAARAMFKKDDSKPPTSEKSTDNTKSNSTNKTSGKGGKIKNKLSDIKDDAEVRGTSMEDLMAEKQKREKAKAEKAAQEKKAE